MRFGYWLPVFGEWLRTVDDEGMAATWTPSAGWRAGAKRLDSISRSWELNLNDIKGVVCQDGHDDATDAWQVRPRCPVPGRLTSGQAYA